MTDSGTSQRARRDGVWGGMKSLITDERRNTAFILAGKRRKGKEKGGREQAGRTKDSLRPNSPGPGLRGHCPGLGVCSSVSGSLGGWANSNAFSLLSGGKWSV